MDYSRFLSILLAAEENLDFSDTSTLCLLADKLWNLNY